MDLSTLALAVSIANGISALALRLIVSMTAIDGGRQRTSSLGVPAGNRLAYASLNLGSRATGSRPGLNAPCSHADLWPAHYPACSRVVYPLTAPCLPTGERAEIPAGAGRDRPSTQVQRRTGPEHRRRTGSARHRHHQMVHQGQRTPRHACTAASPTSPLGDPRESPAGAALAAVGSVTLTSGDDQRWGYRLPLSTCCEAWLCRRGGRSIAADGVHASPVPGEGRLRGQTTAAPLPLRGC